MSGLSLGLGFSKARKIAGSAALPPSPPPLPPAVPAGPPVGFHANGASNTALKAMISDVKAGTRRGTIVWKGDSTSVETGAGTGSLGTDGAYAKGLKPTLATLLTASGLPTLNKAVVGDASLQEAGVSYTAYDPRVVRNAWDILPSKLFAGGGIWQDSGASAFTLTETGVNSFEFVAYDTGNGGITYSFLIDGAAPTVGPAILVSGGFGGFVKATVGVATVGTHTLSITCNSRSAGFRSIKPFNSTVKGVDILCHASGGARSFEQASAGAGFQNLDAITYDAPDLAIINCVLNDVASGVSTADCVASNAAMVNAARLTGSPLLIFPQPAGMQFEGLAPYNTALKAWAAANGVPFFSFWEYYGSPATLSPTFASRLYDGLVHPKEELYVEMAGVLKRVIDAMAA